MADDEKIVRINVSGDASEFNSEIKRAATAMQESFKELKFDDLLAGADKQFDNVADKIDAIKSKLQEQRKEVNERYDIKSTTGNDAFKNRVEQQRKDENKTFDEAEKKLNAFSEAVEKGRKASDKKRESDEKHESSKRQSNEQSSTNPIWGQMMRKTFGGDFKSFNPQAGLTEGMVGRGGLAGEGGMLAGMGTGGMLAAGAAAAAAGIIIKGMSDGWEQVRRDNKNASVFSQNFRGSYNVDSGMDSNDYAAFALQTAQSRGSGDNIGQETIRRAYLKNAYGLQDQDTQQFDKFTFQGGSDATTIIAEILKRSETKGLLGVDKGDFARIPQILSTVSGIMGMQKASSENVDEGFATSVTLAGQRIGGNFSTDKLGGIMQGLNSGIQSPQNGGMQAYIFEALKRANPNASFTDILAMQEGGANGENMKAILPGIMRMPQGEMRRMALSKLGMKQQDANRLDKDGNLEEFMKSTYDSGKLSNTGDDAKYDDIRKRSDSFLLEQDKMWDAAKAGWRSFWGNLMTDLDTGLKKSVNSTPTGRSNSWSFDQNFGDRFNKTYKPANRNDY